MREIKFRGWFQGINGTEMWVYGYLVKQTNGNWEITNGETYWTVDNVGEFTGLLDKNGNEIYEGDILEVDISDEPLGVVVFEDGCFKMNQNLKFNTLLSSYNTKIMVTII